MKKLICPYRKKCDGPCEHSKPHDCDESGIDHIFGHDCTLRPCKHVQHGKKGVTVYCKEMTEEEQIVEAL